MPLLHETKDQLCQIEVHDLEGQGSDVAQLLCLKRRNKDTTMSENSYPCLQIYYISCLRESP